MVCLVHGLGVSHRTFVPLWRLLPRAQCPDLPGDDVPALVASLRRATPPGVVLVASSLGAQVAIELAVAEPGRVAGLVLIGPTGDPAQRRFLPQLARPVDHLLPRLGTPTVVARGDRDPICRREWVERVAGLVEELQQQPGEG